ncbi:hypothetical protein GTQ40_03785 [Flavobacteriaceae bacterium R38]|nr:hypothetical protein [Flavobacteriaceae bacterium R38]
MKKKQLNLRKLSFKKSTVAGFKANQINGGTGTSWYGCETIPGEPCFETEFCGTGACGTNNCGTNDCGTGACGTNNCGTAGCIPATLDCPSHSICPPGIACF